MVYDYKYYDTDIDTHLKRMEKKKMNIFKIVCFWWFLVFLAIVSWMLALQNTDQWIITIKVQYIFCYLACKILLVFILKYTEEKEIKK